MPCSLCNGIGLVDRGDGRFVRCVCRQTKTPAEDYRDVCASRHGGNEHSRQANLKAAPVKASTRERIRIFVAASGSLGTTLRQIAECFGRHPNELSGRVTELKRDAVIFDSGRSRDGCAVLVGNRSWCNGSEAL